ncbi:MAG: 2-C-methyl-D-erythritol 4-phosphate cytidylyltransferase, partial [Sphaerochaetaceae bacterium]|nr:2-C-methyl-D-erythritol 4-phosphate cytidylyltransferase [Sphaerochaetaceae bacterium]
MNIALIIAGGNGQRMHQDIPKQFINVEDKPVIIYTLEAFQRHPDIDSIFVVCLDGWHEILSAYANQFQITKLKKIVSGGVNGQNSIKNGVLAIKEI